MLWYLCFTLIVENCGPCHMELEKNMLQEALEDTEQITSSEKPISRVLVSCSREKLLLEHIDGSFIYWKISGPLSLSCDSTAVSEPCRFSPSNIVSHCANFFMVRENPSAGCRSVSMRRLLGASFWISIHDGRHFIVSLFQSEWQLSSILLSRSPL